MTEPIIVVICTIFGAICGQAAVNLLFPSVTRDEKESQLAWMKCQEDINRLLRERVTRLEALASQGKVSISRHMYEAGAIQPLDLRNNEGKK